MKKSSGILILFFIFLGLNFTSCNNDDDVKPSENKTILKDGTKGNPIDYEDSGMV